MTRSTFTSSMPGIGRDESDHGPPRRRVLIDCPAAHAMFDERSTAGIGGAEFRAATFARGLAALGDWDVLFVLASREPRSSEQHGGVRVVHEVDASRAGTGLRGRLHRAARRWVGSIEQRCLGWPARRADFPGRTADVVATFGVSNRTASVVRVARARGQAVVLFITSDRTLDDILRQGRRDRGLYGEIGPLCRYALRHADAVVAQTRHQADELRRVASVPAVVIRNPIAVSVVDEATRPRETREPYVLWVGRADNDSKRADLALEVARRCPSRRFVLVMNPHDVWLFDELSRTRPDNVTIIPQVPWRQMDHYYRHADWLVNTSNREGMPNAFLQAGMQGVPVASLNADPDGLLTLHGGGVWADGRMDRLVDALQRIDVGSADYRAMARRIRERVLDLHDAEARCRELADLLAGLVERRAEATLQRRGRETGRGNEGMRREAA